MGVAVQVDVGDGVWLGVLLGTVGGGTVGASVAVAVGSGSGVGSVVAVDCSGAFVGVAWTTAVGAVVAVGSGVAAAPHATRIRARRRATARISGEVGMRLEGEGWLGVFDIRS